MTTHSSILAWKIPWMVEPGRLQSMGWQRVRHDWATSLSLRYFRLLDFSRFVRQAYITKQFPLETVFTVPHRFWIILFPFLNFLFDFFHRPIGCLVAYCLASTYSCFFFSSFFLQLISSLTVLWSEMVLDMISIFLNLLRLVWWHSMWSIL